MLKNRSCLSENGPFAPSCKIAKDKSNSTTMLLVRDTKNVRRGSHCSSEKDSGYSDGSDWQQTDIEDQQSNTSQQRASGHAGISHKVQNKGLEYRNTENTSMMFVKIDPQPLYIIKDIKQSTMTQTKSPMLLSNGILCGSPPVIVLEQPSFTPTPLQLHKPLSWKSGVTEKKRSSTYLPILNSYPRIAPHPTKKPPDKSSSNHESQNLSKRMCTERKTDETPVTRALPEQHPHKQPKLAVSNSGLLCFTSSKRLSSSIFTTASTSLGPSSTSTQHTVSSPTTARGLQRNVTTSTHHRRFLNTVELLRQSGLLDITLNTEELLCQSNATEQEVSQLRHHTELLCQAASSPSLSLSGTAGWELLHQVMEESGSYPNLRVLQKLQNPLDLVNQPESISTGDMNRWRVTESSGVPPSHLFTANPEQVKKLKVNDKSADKVTFMSPDSSTG